MVTRGWAVFVLAVTCAGCDAILGLNHFTFDGGSDATDECIGPNGCWACIPTTNDQILNSCSTVQCVSFDPSRLTQFLTPDGSLPPLPAVQDAALDTSDSMPADAGGN